MRFVAVPEDVPLREWVGLMQRATILQALFPMRVALSVRLLQLGRGRDDLPAAALGSRPTAT